MESKGSVVLSVMLTVLVVGLVGYIVYDKVAKPETKCNVGEITKESENKNVADNNEVETNFVYTNLSTEFTDAEIKDAIQNYFNLYKAGSAVDLLKLWGFADFKVEKYEHYMGGNDTLWRTDIEYDKFKKKMLEYMTEGWFTSGFSNEIKFVDADGFVGYWLEGDFRFEANVSKVFKLKDNPDQIYYAIEDILLAGGTPKDISKFEVEKVNGKCVINYVQK